MLRSLLTILFVTMICMTCNGPCVGANEETTIILHAIDALSTTCQSGGDLDCDQVRANTSVQGMQHPWIFVFLQAYEGVAGLNAAFAVPGSWSYVTGYWDCRNPSLVLDPEPPWGPIAGTLYILFDPLFGGHLALVGRMQFLAALDQCMEVIDSSDPNGTYVLDLTMQVTPIAPASRGRVCVGNGGIDACAEGQPVTPVTWGRIKVQYDAAHP